MERRRNPIYAVICFALLLIFLLVVEYSTEFLIFLGINPFREDYLWNFISVVGTAGAILLAYFLYWLGQQNKEKAQINAIIEELRHNLAVSKIYRESEKPHSKEVQYIISRLDKLSYIDQYPNPDKDESLFTVSDNYDPRTFFNIPPDANAYIFPFKNSAISQALTSGSAAILLPRTYINLGHLDYSITRINISIDKWNNGARHGAVIRDIKREYYTWVHFRLLFTLLDILRKYPLRKIYYKNLYNEFKALAGDKWQSKAD